MTPDSPSYKWWMALTVVPAGLISGIDGTSVGIALPSMMVSLGADLDQIQWVVSTSLIIQTLLMPMAGWLTGLLGSRNLFVACLLLFTAGTVLCSFAWNAQSLIFFRAVQGLGGGPLQPVSMALLYSVFPPTQRGTAVGLFNLSTALGLTIGRFAGFLVEAFDWRMIFYMTLPFGAFSAVLGFVLLPQAGPRQQWSIDVWGLLTMAGFLVPLLVALTQGRHAGWDSASIRALFALAFVSCIAFLAVEWRSTAPLVELRLYKNFDFAMGSIVNVMATVLFMSSTFLINIFLQQVYQFTPAQVGVLTFPQGVVYGIVSLVSGRLADVADPRVPLVLGLACFAPVYYWLGSISALATASALMGMLCLRSVSFSSVNSPNMLLALQSLPEDKVRTATGLFSVARGVAGTFGVALSAAFLEHRREVHAIQLAQEQGLRHLPSQWALASLQDLFAGLGDGVGLARLKAGAQVQNMMLQEAAIAAYQDVFLLSALISLCTIIPGLLRKSAPRSSSPTARHSA